MKNLINFDVWFLRIDTLTDRQTDKQTEADRLTVRQIDMVITILGDLTVVPQRHAATQLLHLPLGPFHIGN